MIHCSNETAEGCYKRQTNYPCDKLPLKLRVRLLFKENEIPLVDDTFIKCELRVKIGLIESLQKKKKTTRHLSEDINI